MAQQLESRYSHLSIEEKWYRTWEEGGLFSAENNPVDPDLPPFCIVIPPPNVTGQLHVGHALNNTIQDLLARMARKQGRRTLWLPGTDHAGIATQSRVEKMLAEQGLSRFDLGRDAFIDRVWEWKEEYGGKITAQLRKMGFSVDWSRERFTMDEGLSHAVRRVFVDLYNEGLIYRDTRMVNWDPVSQTVLSDLEVEYDEGHTGELWEFAYPLSDGSGEIVVATTRPETMLGDTAIAVHPDDLRYRALIGRTVRHPLLDRAIPIIGDSILVDPEFGTGAVKVTPAHDPNDYEVGRRHNLELITIFDGEAKVNAAGGEFAGLDRFEARKVIKERIAALGLDRGTKEHTMSLGRSQRSGAVVEPMVSTQWFVRIKPLAEPAIEAVRDGRIRFVPSMWANTYYNWMGEIRDWCISRQLWWGHQIPAWHCSECGKVSVSMEDLSRCSHCDSAAVVRDPDVLDTWFSSGLWPFSTLGWPDQTSDLRTWYPTTVLVTAYDIIFFWVARMIMLGMHFMKEVPFAEVYIHGLMRDEKGRKISKSLGNNIDPVDVINEYGADAYRFFLIATLTEGKDSTYSESRLKGYQNFANKIWNSTRFVLMNLEEGFRPDFTAPESYALESEDWWILARLESTIAEVGRSVGEYRFHIAAEVLYQFIWNNFCDWYIEFVKPRLYGKQGEESAEAARQTVYFVLESLLGLVHPFMPFISEELYAHLRPFHSDAARREQLLIVAPWPALPPLSRSGEVTARIEAIEMLQEAIGSARMIRAEVGIAPDRKVPLVLRSTSAALAAVVAEKELAVLRLAAAESIEVVESYAPGKDEAMEAFVGGEVWLPLAGVLDLDKERARIAGEEAKLLKMIAALRGKLGNPGFRDKAPAEVIAKEEAKLVEMEEKCGALSAALKRLG